MLYILITERLNDLMPEFVDRAHGRPNGHIAHISDAGVGYM